MKSILIFYMVATGAALYAGPGAGEHFAAPMVAPASRVPEKPHQGTGKTCASHGATKPTTNGGFDCAYHDYNATTGPRSRCCCYLTQNFYGGAETTCYRWTDDTIKAILADSKIEHGDKKKDLGEDGHRNVNEVPWAERKGYAAIKKLVSDHPGWCPDVEQKKGLFANEDWCPDWHSKSDWGAHQRSPVQFVQEKCEAAEADDAFRIEGCVVQKDGTGATYVAADLVKTVDADYHEDEMCCCYTYPDYSGIVGDTEACYRMFHEDVVYVQEQLGLWADKGGQNETSAPEEVADVPPAPTKGGLPSKEESQKEEYEAREGREALGLRKDWLGSHKCPKAHWKESWEIGLSAVREVGEGLANLVLWRKDKDNHAAAFSYPCPTKKITTWQRTCAARIFGTVGTWLIGKAYHKSVMEPSNTPSKCKERAQYWQPRLCY